MADLHEVFEALNERLAQADISLEMAYGTDWLVEFYREHQEEVNRLM